MNELKILSWNIDSVNPQIKSRTTRIIQLIIKANPDVICLQEVGYINFNILYNNLGKLGYYLPIGQVQRIYFHTQSTLTFLRRGITGGVLIIPHIESLQRRDILKIKIDTPWSDVKSMNIYNVHLDNSLLVREKQLKSIASYLRIEGGIVCGDFNHEGEIIDISFNDLRIGPTKFNRTLPYSRGLCDDHILHSFDLECKLDQIIGHEPYYDNKVNIWCSNHNGILVKVEPIMDRWLNSE